MDRCWQETCHYFLRLVKSVSWHRAYPSSAACRKEWHGGICFRHQWQPIRGSLYQRSRPYTHIFGDVNQLYLVQLIDSASSGNRAVMANFKLKFHPMKVSLSCLSQAEDLRAVVLIVRVKSSLFSQKHESNLGRSLRIVFPLKEGDLLQFLLI